MKTLKVTLVTLALGASTAYAGPGGKCADLPSPNQLKSLLNAAAALAGPPVGGAVGGLFAGTRMWAAVVNRDGALCGAATSTDDETQVWPGSQAIAKAKAFTGNAFSLDTLPLSSAQLYTFTQPGHSLWSLGQSNLWKTAETQAPDANNNGNGDKIAGGLIFFGGGVPLYKAGKIVGGLGISGDTSCADHEIAKRVRHLAGLNPPGGPLADDIQYSAVDPPSPFIHPLCPNTFRNGAFIGNEANATGY